MYTFVYVCVYMINHKYFIAYFQFFLRVGKKKEPTTEFFSLLSMLYSVCQSPPKSCGPLGMCTSLTRTISAANCSKSFLINF